MCVFCLRYGRLIAIAGLQTDRLEMVSAPVWYMGCWKFLSEAVRPKVYGQTKGR